MKAMIFAAGLGTRLQTLTAHKPKALMEVNGHTLLEIAIRKLAQHGVNQIVINVHHFAEQIKNYLKSNDNFGLEIAISDETDELLDTGGGLKKAEHFFDDGKAFFVYNADIISDIDLTAMYQAHYQNDALATLAVRKRAGSRFLLFNEAGLLAGWENMQTGERIIARQSKGYKQLAFSGIHVVSPAIFRHFTQVGKFSIVKSYLQLAKKHPIRAFRHDRSFWMDMGKPERFTEIQQSNFDVLLGM